MIDEVDRGTSESHHGDRPRVADDQDPKILSVVPTRSRGGAVTAQEEVMLAKAIEAGRMIEARQQSEGGSDERQRLGVTTVKGKQATRPPRSASKPVVSLASQKI